MNKIASMNAFVKVAELSSFSLAATHLGVGSGSVTRAISSLENKLGVKLMARTTRRISLTPAGEAYLECCRNVLELIESVESEIGGHTFALSGAIRVGVSNPYGNQIFGTLLTKFAKNHPGIKFEMCYFDGYTHAVSSEIDIAFLVSGEGKKSSDLMSLGTVQMRLVASPEYLRNHGRPAHPTDLIDHKCLNSSSQALKPSWKFVVNTLTTDYTVNSRLNTSNGEGLLEAALAGLGLACLPSSIVGHPLSAGVLETVLDEFPLAPLEAMMTVPASKLVTYRTKALAAFVSGEFACPPGLSSASMLPT